MNIFISYSRRDAGDFAKQISESLIEEHNVFTDINNIQVGDIWSNTIENNITTCDIFVVIVTFAALRSPEVEKEVLKAQKHNKKIIPCIYSEITKNEIKWGLGKFQGIEFTSEYELAREIYSKIAKYENKIPIDTNEHTKTDIAHSESAKVDDVRTTAIPTIKSNVDDLQQKKDTVPLKGAMGAIGGGVQSKHSESAKVDDVRTTAIPTIKSNVDDLQQKKDTVPLKGAMGAIGGGVQSKHSESAKVDDVRTTAIPTIKSNVDDLQQKKDTVPLKGAMGAIGGGVQSKHSESAKVDDVRTTAIPTIKSNVDDLQQKKDTLPPRPQRNNLKILIPIVAVIGAVIAFVVFGSGIMQQLPSVTQPSPPIVNPDGVNHLPLATDQSITTNKNTPVNIKLAGSDLDQNDSLTASIVSQPSHGSVSDINQDTGIVTYKPDSGFTGNDIFTFQVNDGNVDSSNVANVNIKVNRD